MQFNQFLRAMPPVTITQNLVQSFVPIMWVDEGIELNDELVDYIWTSLTQILIILDAVHWTLFAVGLTLFVAMLVWLIVVLHKRRSSGRHVGSYSPTTK